jgi:hypothetical protein
VQKIEPILAVTVSMAILGTIQAHSQRKIQDETWIEE